MMSAADMQQRLAAIRARHVARRGPMLSEAAMRQKVLGLTRNAAGTTQSTAPTGNIVSVRLK